MTFAALTYGAMGHTKTNRIRPIRALLSIITQIQNALPEQKEASLDL